MGQYADVNGLHMYYETHGPSGGIPLILMHGGLSATGSSFGALLPGLAENRRVISIEQQAHGHTADIDRPLSVPQMGEDTAALLAHLGIEKADFFGYSMGAGTSLWLALNKPELVRKLVLATISYNDAGMHPGLAEGVAQTTPEMLVGTPWEAEYKQVAPNPDDWPVLIAKNSAMAAAGFPQFSPDDIRAMAAPVLLIFGDSDIVTPEHIVELFRLLGGGVVGEMGMPKSQLAVIPATPHSLLTTRADLLLAIIPPFLDAPD